jgi:formate dehydrogenase subunit gamma
MGTPLTEALLAYGPWGLAGTVGLLVLFALLRGRVRIQPGWGGWTIPRFSGIERLVHWLLALSFVILALTGLNALYGARVLLPLVGPDAFGNVRLWSRLLHNNAAFPFMFALALVCLLWIRHNLPHWRDVTWLVMGGGLLVRRWQPAAWKFNAGQKIFYWTVVLGGLVLSLTGLTMLFPGTAVLSKSIALLNGLGLRLPANLTPVEEMQHASAWHAASALALTCLVAVHIYLRTYGIQGAFSAMGSGTVDVNWARQHHGLWAAREVKRVEDASATKTPAPSMAPAE